MYKNYIKTKENIKMAQIAVFMNERFKKVVTKKAAEETITEKELILKALTLYMKKIHYKHNFVN